MNDVSPVADTHSSSARSLRTFQKVTALGVLTLGGVLVVMETSGVTGSTLTTALSAAVAGPLDELGVPIDSLRATPGLGEDYDGDGLSDKQELVLGTYAFTADSDEDGFNDGEELARQSDPQDQLSIPETQNISASITARGENGALRLVICVYEPADQLTESMIRFGALRDGRVISVPMGRLLGLADVHVVDGSNGSRVITIEIPINPAFVHTAGRVTFFLAAGNATTLQYESSAKIDVSSADNILLLQRVSAGFAQVQATQGGGSIRQPIPSSPTPTIPSTWVAGAICFQRTTVVGGAGAIVLHQVVEADCLLGWETYCASDCSSGVGSTFETIDPAALLGG